MYYRKFLSLAVVLLIAISTLGVASAKTKKDSDSLPEYEKLDRILYQYIELRKGPKEIIESGYEKELVDRILKLVNTNEYKRNQFCPIIRVSCKAFGIGRRVPIVGKYLS